VEKLTESGRMHPAGLAVIETARQNGTWNILDEVEELIIPEDLEKALRKSKGSKEYFLSLSKTARKMMLHWVAMARQAETRQKRIAEIAESAAQRQKPERYR
jgi:uncharacterized protein YdeI (YjbR/CyaY-like superfamily)